MNIQRFHFYNIYGTPIPDNKAKDDSGDYVLHTAHAAEVERLTAERDAAVARVQGLDHIVDYIRERLGLPEDGFEDDVPRGVEALCNDLDAAVARAERAEEALRKVSDLKMAHVSFAPSQYYICVQSIVSSALAVTPDKQHYAALSPEPWGGTEGEGDA